MGKLLKEYRESLKSAKQMREAAPEEDKKIITGMVSSLGYAVDWLRTERRPFVQSKSASWDSEWDEFSEAHADPYSESAFEEVENRIDSERRMMQRAANT